MKRLLRLLTFICAVQISFTSIGRAEPRIVNIYNFCRNSDYRVPDSERVLLDATSRQLKLTHAYDLPATWALQYDALINPAYQKLMRAELRPEDELAAWWEIPRPLAEKAGLKWRGENDWDSASNVGFSPGYTPDERRRLVDVYMADFKSIFGRYPRTVGSWYIDEVTLAYMVEKYGVVASCNCKDQIGTDGYTLWGGYWNQAYYPSKLNAYMPAQSGDGQIPVPIFRMLGSDPIYQYGNANGIVTLEPVYPAAGGSPAWVDWFFKTMTEQPALAFAYTQAGQENSFGWDAMGKGLAYQLKALAQLKAAGKVRVETLEQSGAWFKSQFKTTPPTSVVAVDDPRHEGRRTVWYDSRYYRMNLLWDAHVLMIRDLHRFDEKKTSPTHEAVLTNRSLAYETLPVIEGVLWGTAGSDASAVPMMLGAAGEPEGFELEDAPRVTAASATDLKVVQPLKGGGNLTISLSETAASFEAKDSAKRPLNWALQLRGGQKQAEAITRVVADRIDFRSDGYPYSLRLGAGSVDRREDGSILLRADATGRLNLSLNE